MSSHTGLEIPDVPEFDDRQVRRAITRGVLRTAVVVVLWLFVLATIGQLVSTGLQEGFGRGERFQQVVATGLLVAHPEYEYQGGGCCNASLLTLKVDVTVSPRTASSNPPETDVWLSQNVLGHVDPSSAFPLPQTDLGILALSPPPRLQGERVMDRLPDGMLASGVVTFQRPLDQMDLSDFFERSGVFAGPDVSLILAWAPVGPSESRWPVGPISWQMNPSDDSLPVSVDGFRTWVSTLSSADDENLSIVGVPPVATLQQVADEGTVVGLVLGGTPVRQFQKMLNDSDVQSVGLGDVAFNLGGQGF